MPNPKIFSSVLSKEKDWRKDIAGVCSKVKKDLGGRSCDLAIFFVSQSYRDFDEERFLRLLSDELGCQNLLGCNSSGVIADDKEVEMEAAVSVLAMHLPGVKINPFYLSSGDINHIKTGPDLINFFDIYPTEKPRFICLADPSSCDVTGFLGAFNEAYRGLPMIGGLASGGMLGAENWLVLNHEIYRDGAVGVALVGDIEFETIVSQGCRPIGQPYIITKAEENILHELAGRPAVAVLQELLGKLSAKDKELAKQSLFVGLVMNEKKASFKRGDFLIRNIMGFDPESGAVAVGEYLKVGHTLQFHLRDAETSEEDLKILLGKMHESRTSTPQGGILVSCCGRGKGLYGKPDHDAKMIQAARGPLPLAGFFANGEIGPVDSKNYVHGYTSSLVILR